MTTALPPVGSLGYSAGLPPTQVESPLESQDREMRGIWFATHANQTLNPQPLTGSLFEPVTDYSPTAAAHQKQAEEKKTPGDPDLEESSTAKQWKVVDVLVGQPPSPQQLNDAAKNKSPGETITPGDPASEESPTAKQWKPKLVDVLVDPSTPANHSKKTEENKTLGETVTLGDTDLEESPTAKQWKNKALVDQPPPTFTPDNPTGKKPIVAKKTLTYLLSLSRLAPYSRPAAKAGTALFKMLPAAALGAVAAVGIKVTYSLGFRMKSLWAIFSAALTVGAGVGAYKVGKHSFGNLREATLDFKKLWLKK